MPARKPPDAIPKSKATKNVELAAPRRSGATACIAIVCKEGWMAPKL